MSSFEDDFDDFKSIAGVSLIIVVALAISWTPIAIVANQVEKAEDKIEQAIVQTSDLHNFALKSIFVENRHGEDYVRFVGEEYDKYAWAEYRMDEPISEKNCLRN